MKYVVTAMNVNRKGYQVHTWDDGSITKSQSLMLLSFKSLV